MDRRRFLVGTGAAAAALAAGVKPALAGAGSATGQVEVGFAPPGGGRVLATSLGGERLAGRVEARLALCGVQRLDAGEVLQVEAAVAEGPRFAAACAQQAGGLLQVSAPRRIEAQGALELLVAGERVRLGQGGLPWLRGSYVVALGWAPCWGELLLEGGVLQWAGGGAVERPHLVVGLERVAALGV